MTATPKVTIYTTWMCPYCYRAKALLTKKGVAFEEIDAPNGSQAREDAMAKSGGGRTVPQIFIGEEAVGGFDELQAMENAGRLDALLAG